CNTLLTLCHITDKMMCSYLKVLERRFVEQGGIKERMHAARTGYRQPQDKLLEKLKVENEQLKAEVKRLEAELGMKKLEG
uniref:four helix bundle suffix domain-containing protein n=1 Tax=Hoylesella loescheii TaxID=840 RepID=UPI0028E20CF8